MKQEIHYMIKDRENNTLICSCCRSVIKSATRFNKENLICGECFATLNIQKSKEMNGDK